MVERAPIAGVVLAGGLARRMGGGDKALVAIAGRPLLAHVIARVRPQVDALAINANGDPARFAAFRLPVVADVVGGHAGPLAGVLSGLAWARAAVPEARWLLTVATDAPFVPDDLVARLEAAAAEADMACAASGGRHHPVFGLWPLALYEDLRAAVVDEGVRKVDAWTGRYRLGVADFPVQPRDPFFNVNTGADREAAEALLAVAS